MTLRDQIAQQAMALPPEDRAYVAELLEVSLHEGDLSDQEITEAWTQEIERRVQAYDRGETTAVDFETALEQARQALEARRAARAGLQ